jgi:hypothetical protein
MEYSNYFRTLEIIYKVKLDSTLRNTIQNHFTEELNLFTEQDMYEHSRKAILSYCFRKINSEKIK